MVRSGSVRGRAGLRVTLPAALGLGLVVLLSGIGVVPAVATESLAAAASRPFGSHPVPFPAGSAAAPGGVASADAATAAAYDDWKADYLVAGCGAERYYVDASTSTDSLVVSEGQGYGMVITALMAGHDPAARTEFDGLYRYVLDHPSSSDPGLMGWHQDEHCESFPNDDSSATDGDLDIAYGLLLADSQWGSTGAIDYAAEALDVIAAVKRSEINPVTLLPLLGDWTSSGDGYWFGVRTSDIMVDHFLAFENATGDPFWGQVARASTSLVAGLQASYAPSTGLVPDFAIDTDTVARPAPPNYLESPDDGAYGYNAARTPWRFASSAQLAGDAASAAAALRIADWAIGATDGNPSRLRAGYALDGRALVSYSDLVFTAPFGAGAVADARDRAWVGSVWSLLRSTPSGGYFADSLRLQVMLLVSGNSWLPTTSSASAVVRIGGDDRYAVSAAVSASTLAPGASVVYLASGEVFPDALSASAAAGAAGTAVLLVRRDDVPSPVAAELVRLAPASIVVLGGPNTIAPSLVAGLARFAPAVSRVEGPDRYAVAAAVSARTFAPGGRVAFVASGEVFPDALSGSAAAGASGAPVLLTRRDSVPPAVAAELRRRLQPASIVVLGGPNTVAASTVGALNAIAPTTRVGGTDRFAVAAAISARTFDPGRTRTVYVASGEVFPDALSASATAVADHGPVLLVTRSAVPASTAAELTRLSPTRIVVLGGPNTVSPAVVSALAAYLR